MREKRLIDDAIDEMEATKRLRIIEACRLCAKLSPESMRPRATMTSWRDDRVCTEMNNR